MTKAEAQRTLLAIWAAIVETVREVEPDGAPATSIYLAMMGHGCTFEQFETIMSALVEAGRLRKSVIFTSAGSPGQGLRRASRVQFVSAGLGRNPLLIPSARAASHCSGEVNHIMPLLLPSLSVWRT
jgi:hypothetical protein